MPRRLPVRSLSILAAAMLVASTSSAEAAAAPPACGIRSPASFVDTQTGNSITLQKTPDKGDRVVWNTNDNRSLVPTAVHIRYVGTHFSFYGRGENFTIAGQGNLQSVGFGGSLVERKVVRVLDNRGRVKTKTERTVRNLFASGGKSQWVPCPPVEKKKK